MAQYHVGELDQLISIKRQTYTSTGKGGKTRTGYTYVAQNIWARVHPASGTEQVEHERLRAPARYVFAIHWRSDVLDTDVIEWNSQEYQIRFIPTRGSRDVFLPLEAERGVTV